MPQINPNTKAPSSAEEAKANKAFEEANSITKRGSVIESWFGLPNDERVGLRNALLQALLNRPVLATRTEQNTAQEQMAQNFFSTIGDVSLGRGYWGRQTPEQNEDNTRALSKSLQEYVTKIIPEAYKDR